MKISVDQLKQTCLKALRYYGYTQDEAQTIQDVLMYAQLRGNNQGVVKLVGAGLPKDPKASTITVRKETSISALLDAGRNAGMVVMMRAVDVALQKAREHGIGIVGTIGTVGSTGAIGYFARQIAESGFIGIIASGSPETVAMFGSYEPIFGTNPLAFGVPTKGEPVVFDMATAAIARYGVIEAQTAGRALPEGVAYDNNGNLTTDPGAALQGAIRAFGGYKGAGLALMVEILTRPLIGAKTVDGRKTNVGNLVVALDPGLLVERDDFNAEMTTLINRVKDTKKLPGVAEIDVPGERGNRIWQEIERTGQIEIEPNLWQQLQDVAARFKG